MRVKISKPPPPAPTASAIGPCPTVIKIAGRPGTGSLPSTIAPPDQPHRPKQMYSTDTGRPILLKYGSIRDLAGGPVGLEVERFIRYASTKVHDAYSVHPTYSILQGIQLELQSGRTRSDRRQKRITASIYKHILCDDRSAACSRIDASMQ